MGQNDKNSNFVLESKHVHLNCFKKADTQNETYNC